jgi:predicted acetyltransferase
MGRLWTCTIHTALFEDTGRLDQVGCRQDVVRRVSRHLGREAFRAVGRTGERGVVDGLCSAAGRLTMVVCLGPAHEAALAALVGDFHDHGEGTFPGLFVVRDDWDHPTRVAKLAAWHEGRELEPGRVPCSTWFWEEDGELLGVLNFRHHLAGTLDRYGGHIGYAVRPSARGRGIAKALLRYGMAAAAERGIASLVLTTGADNLPSQGVILACGGVLDGSYDWEGRPTRRFRLATG